MLDQFPADHLLYQWRPGLPVGQQKPADGERQKEDDAAPVRTFYRSRMSRLPLPEGSQQATTAQNYPERSFGKRRRRRHQPKPGPTPAQQPGAKGEKGGGGHGEREDTVGARKAEFLDPGGCEHASDRSEKPGPDAKIFSSQNQDQGCRAEGGQGSRQVQACNIGAATGERDQGTEPGIERRLGGDVAGKVAL